MASTQKAHNLLIIGPSWVGDMVMAQVLFKVLKQRYPQSNIDVLAPAWSGPLLACMPEVRGAIASPFAHGQWSFRQRCQLGRQLVDQGYQQAIVLPNSWKSAVIPWAAKIPKRSAWRGECRWGLLNDVRYLDKQRYALMIERFAALGLPPNAALPEELPWPRLETKPEQVAQSLASLKLSTHRRIVALCPGAEFGPSKQWPIAYYAEVAKTLIKRGIDVWVLGSKKDAPVGDEICLAAPGSVNLAGRTQLNEAIDLLSVVDFVVTNDSGLMHIAAALDKPLVAMYGSTSSQFTPPLSKRARLLQLAMDCRPCFKRDCPLQHHRCMRDLKPQQVMAAIDAQLTVTS